MKQGAGSTEQGAPSRDIGSVLPAPSSLPHDLWVVVTAYNEAGRIGAVLDELLKIVTNIIVVDDGSSDDTCGEVLKRSVWLCRHLANLGQGAALQTGIRFALDRNASCLVTFDADGQHQPHDIGALVTALAHCQADFALGSRFLGSAPGIPWTRKLMLRLAARFGRLLSGLALTDVHNGLRAMTRKGAERIRITMNRMEHASEIIDQIAKSGLKYVEVPVTIRYTAETLAKGQKSSAAICLGLKLLLQKVIR